MVFGRKKLQGQGTEEIKAKVEDSMVSVDEDDLMIRPPKEPSSGGGGYGFQDDSEEDKVSEAEELAKAFRSECVGRYANAKDLMLEPDASFRARVLDLLYAIWCELRRKRD